jgi:hypothetical protein
MYKSIAGAFLTLVITICSFGYLVYLSYLWGSDLIIPKIVVGNNFKADGKTLTL